MRPIAERFICFYDVPFYIVERNPFSENIGFSDKNYICFRQFFEFIACQQEVAVQDAAVIPCTLRHCTAFLALNLNIKLPPAVVSRHDIKPY